MFRNYMKIALRNMLKNKVYAFINIFGFAIGIASFILIGLHVADELSYDKFYNKIDRIYRVVLARQYPDRVKNWTQVSPKVGDAMRKDYPELEIVTGIYFYPFEVTVRYEDKRYLEPEIAFADSNFFDVFEQNVIMGTLTGALANPNTVILTEETASKIFPDVDPIGKIIEIPIGTPNVDYMVTGVIKNIPRNSHMDFDMLLSRPSIIFPPTMSWFTSWDYYTYVVLNENVNAEEFNAKLEGLVTNYFRPEVERVFRVPYEDYLATGNGYTFFLQKAKDIHLYSNYDTEIKANSNIIYVFVFSSVALLVLLMGCINFTNLTTARSAGRMREIGVRKTVGSTRNQLVKQFLVESIFQSMIAMFFAIMIVKYALPSFENFTGKSLALDLFGNFYILPGLILFAVVIGIISGSYPAFFLSSFQPSLILKGTGNFSLKSSFLRNILVVFQFSASLLLISGTFIIAGQIEFLVNKDIGFDKENVMVIESAQSLGNQVESFKEALTSNPEIISASGSRDYPGDAQVNGLQRLGSAGNRNAISFYANFVDHEYIETMGMEVISGRGFSKDFGTDTMAVLINETAVMVMGAEEPLEDALTNSGRTLFDIIGVLKDFNFQSLHSQVEPLFLRLKRNNRATYISIRFTPGDLNKRLEIVKTQWDKLTGGVPFKYSFVDEKVNRFYESENLAEKLSTVFSALAIIIGCLGLFGLSAFTAEQKTKEIGIRKALGAETMNIVVLLSTEFIILIGIAIAISIPISYYAMTQWLNSFAYSIDIPLWTYFFSGIITLVVALMTISYQIFTAAIKNPVDSLKYE